MKFGIIYKITNKDTGKAYIGQTTKSLSQRLKSHLKENKHISNLLRAYGVDSFIIEELCSASNINDLNYLETFMINEYNTLYPLGYNHTKGGDNKGQISEYTRNKLRESHLGHTHNRNRKHSEEYRFMISERKGKLNPIIAISIKNPNERTIFSFLNQAEDYGFNSTHIKNVLDGKRKHHKHYYFVYYSNNSNQANQNGSAEIKNSEHVQRLGSEPSKEEYNLPTSPRVPTVYRGHVSTEELLNKYNELRNYNKVASFFGVKRQLVVDRLYRLRNKR